MEHKIPGIRLLSKRFPKATGVVTAVLVAASLVILFGARFDTDVTRLIPLHAEKTSLYFRIMDRFGGLDKAYIVFSSERLMDHAAEIDRIGAEILNTGLVTHAEWKITDGTRTYLRDIFSKKAPLFLTEQEMQEFVSRLSGEGMSRELKKTKQRLNLPGGADAMAQNDPLNLLEIFAPHIKLGDASFDPLSGYYLTPDRKKLVIVLSPAKPPRDITFSKTFIEGLEKVLSPYRSKGMNIEVTGNHAITLHEASIMKSELLSNASTSFLSVMAIFIIFFRSLKGTLFVLFPALLSVVLTTAAVLLFSGTISEVTGAFAGLIAGLGDDLGIVLYVSYLINLKSSADRTAAMDRSIALTFRSVTTGTMTTALVFLPMLLSSFRGIRELGLLTGAGMLVCWALLFSITPLIIKPSTGRFIEIPPLGRLALRSHHFPYPVIAATLAATVLLALFIPRVPVIGDIAKLGTTDNRPRNVLEELRGGSLREQGIFVTGTAGDPEAALANSAAIKNRLSLSTQDLLGPTDMLPPQADQERNLRILAGLDASGIRKEFLERAGAEGFSTEDMKPFSERLVSMLGNRKLLTMGDLEPVKEAFQRLLRQEGDEWMFMVSGGMKKEAESPDLSGLAYTGPAFIREELMGILKKDALIISIAGLVLVNIILYADLRSLYCLLLCQTPVVFSIFCTLGIMGLTGISLNFMNIIVFVLLFGIGTDYTVHLIHRYHVDRDIYLTFLHTGKAVFVAGLTTIAGFGSIGFSSYQGLASMGQVAAIGTGFCVAFSLVLLPAMMRLSGGRVE